MAEHFESPDPHYRSWSTGAMLLELHAITGAWPEFRTVLAASPELAADVLRWICPEDDWEYAAIDEAKWIAPTFDLRRIGADSNQDGTAT